MKVDYLSEFGFRLSDYGEYREREGEGRAGAPTPERSGPAVGVGDPPPGGPDLQPSDGHRQFLL